LIWQDVAYAKESHYTGCPALELLCNSFCGPLAKMFRDPELQHSIW